MGGYGTWSIAAARPAMWASIVPICGGGVPTRAALIRDTGTPDDVIPVEESRAMVRALRAAGGNPRYKEFHGVGHNSWDPAYATSELFDWLAAAIRPLPTPGS
jgi:predicted peptidase